MPFATPCSGPWLSGISESISRTPRRVNDLIAAEGYSVANADITIAAQRPKLAGYVPRMREALAGILKVDVSQVSVKATTTEHLGFIGREEGIAVWASVLLTAGGSGYP